MRTKFDDYRFSHSGDMIAVVNAENGFMRPDHAPFRGSLSSVSYDIVYVCT